MVPFVIVLQFPMTGRSSPKPSTTWKLPLRTHSHSFTFSPPKYQQHCLSAPVPRHSTSQGSRPLLSSLCLRVHSWQNSRLWPWFCPVSQEEQHISISYLPNPTDISNRMHLASKTISQLKFSTSNEDGASSPSQAPSVRVSELVLVHPPSHSSKHNGKWFPQTSCTPRAYLEIRQATARHFSFLLVLSVCDIAVVVEPILPLCFLTLRKSQDT